MKKAYLIPLILFSIIFLSYSLYFIKVISSQQKVESNSIAKSIKRVLEERKELPSTLYVNYDWLNVRKDPSLASPVIEKIYKNDAVEVLEMPGNNWALIKTASGKRGYVARRYLTDKSTQETAAVPPAAEVSIKVSPTPSPAPVSENVFRIPTITYHHITRDTKQFVQNLVLHEDNFLAQLDYLIASNTKTYTFFDLKAITEGTKAPEKAVILTFDDGYADAYTVAQNLNGKGLKGVFFIITDKVGTPGYLDWRQIKKMRSWGMEIGSHGVTSADLVRTSNYYLKDELERSKLLIEEQLGEPIISFAYPAGSYNKKVLQAAKDAGYSFVRSIEGGSVYTTADLYKIPTLRVFPPAGANQFRVWLGS